MRGHVCKRIVVSLGAVSTTRPLLVAFDLSGSADETTSANAALAVRALALETQDCFSVSKRS